ncbi:MAG TPA: hypothetical protein VJJ53_01930 [Candidatus Nanoarchaeia archaeon]|nr:hypothetical protein [Candidatus Nanoarchaeia archaeon]
MNRLTIIAILLIALVLIAGCAKTAPAGDEGGGSRDVNTAAEDPALEEDVDTSELDDLDLDESLF